MFSSPHWALHWALWQWQILQSGASGLGNGMLYSTPKHKSTNTMIIRVSLSMLSH